MLEWLLKSFNHHTVPFCFQNTLKNGLSTSTLDEVTAFGALKTVFKDLKSIDNDTKKLLVDQGFRDCLTNGYLTDKTNRLQLEKCRFLIELSILGNVNFFPPKRHILSRCVFTTFRVKGGNMFRDTSHCDHGRHFRRFVP